MVHGLVCVAVRFQFPVWELAGTDDCSTEFDPVTMNNNKRVGGSVLIGNAVCFSEIALQTSDHPLPFHSVAPIVLAPTKRGLIDFDSLVRTANILTTAQHIFQNGIHRNGYNE
jgi:hypothetical protein